MWGPMVIASTAAIITSFSNAPTPTSSSNCARYRMESWAFYSWYPASLAITSPSRCATLIFKSFLGGSGRWDSLWNDAGPYEMGAVDGRKVHLLHSDTTPGPILGPIADNLVKKGCRAMTIGRFNLNSVSSLCLQISLVLSRNIIRRDNHRT